MFLFYFENEDLNAVIGNRRQAPFLNRLLPHASLLSNFYAEEHPSDANYLALAGGSAFGVPLTDPLEENSQYTIPARNIGDLIGAAHESWKAYLQSAAGPCDDTVHGNYWDDDEPMTYFADVRERPAYCAAHLLPLEALPGDLASARTTPSFGWVSPDDCADMEGCGIKAGDNFLAAQLGAIMRSPAWRTQRSLAIITFDEDGYDFEHPSQRVATLLIGSAGVRQGYVSHRRYTHYSLLRTIEGALGLGTLTANDSYAPAVTDAFLPGTAGAARMTWLPARRSVPAAVPAGAAARMARPLAAGAPVQPTAFVANSASNSVTPVNLATHKAGKPIGVGRDPQAVAVTPDGAMAYVVNSGSNSVTPIGTVSRRAGTAIPVGADPQAIAITPDGRTAYVTDAGSDSVTPIDLASGRARPIPVGAQPHAIAITPDGRTALVLNWGGASVTPIRLGGAGGFGRAWRPIPVGGYPSAVAIAPDGRTAYVASYGSDTVTPIALGGRQFRAGSPVAAGHAPNAVAVTPDSAKVFAVGGDSDTVTPISAASRRGRPGGPGGVLARGRRGVTVGPDGLRGQHDQRHGDPDRGRDRQEGPRDLGGAVRLPDPDRHAGVGPGHRRQPVRRPDLANQYRLESRRRQCASGELPRRGRGGWLTCHYSPMRTMPVAMTTAAATRRRPKSSRSTRKPMSAAKTTLVSRIAATSASGARLCAQSTMP